MRHLIVVAFVSVFFHASSFGQDALTNKLSDDEIRRGLAGGAWYISTTNVMRASTNMESSPRDIMEVEKTFKNDGTFSLTSRQTHTVPPNSRIKSYVVTNGVKTLIESSSHASQASGIWRVEDSRLYWAVTNSTGWSTNNGEACWKILSLTEKEFKFRNCRAPDSGPANTAVRR